MPSVSQAAPTLLSFDSRAAQDAHRAPALGRAGEHRARAPRPARGARQRAIAVRRVASRRAAVSSSTRSGRVLAAVRRRRACRPCRVWPAKVPPRRRRALRAACRLSCSDGAHRDGRAHRRAQMDAAARRRRHRAAAGATARRRRWRARCALRGARGPEARRDRPVRVPGAHAGARGRRAARSWTDRAGSAEWRPAASEQSVGVCCVAYECRDRAGRLTTSSGCWTSAPARPCASSWRCRNRGPRRASGRWRCACWVSGCAPRAA